MNPWKLILATVVIFGAGIVMGGLLVNYVIHSASTPQHHAPAAPSAANTNRPPADHADPAKVRQPELLSQQFVQRLDDVLQLTPPQRDAIQKIICTGQEQNHAIWTNCAAQSRQVMQEVRQQIRAQLNPDQLNQFEKLLKQTHPAPRHAGTNAVPVPPPATNGPALTTTNLAGACPSQPAQAEDSKIPCAGGG